MREAVSASAAAAAAPSTATSSTTTTTTSPVPPSATSSTSATAAVATLAPAPPTTTVTISPVPVSASATVAAPSGGGAMKRPLTLDLNAKPGATGGAGSLIAKRQRFNSSVNPVPVSILNSPDLQMLKMASPELEKFMTNSQLPTPTPSLVYPSKVTTEQEDYAKGFTDALNKMHSSGVSIEPAPAAGALLPATLPLKLEPKPVVDVLVSSSSSSVVAGPNDDTAADPLAITAASAAATTLFAKLASAGGVVPAAVAPAVTTTSILSSVGISGGSFTYLDANTAPTTATAAASTAPVAAQSPPTVVTTTVVSIKDEPLTAAASPPPHSPIDMDDQERIKLDRKRQRNRLAASKCRKRKLERIAKLEDKVKNLKSDNSDLGMLLKQLKENVCKLKQQVIEHIQSGCDIPMDIKPGATTVAKNGGGAAEPVEAK